MIKLSTTILLLAVSRSRELNFSEIFVVLPVPYFDLYLSAMLEFCRIRAHLKIKKEPSTKDTDRNISI